MGYIHHTYKYKKKKGEKNMKEKQDVSSKKKSPYIKKEKAPYMLIVHTNSYTGHFERELVAYSIGILDEFQKTYGNSFKKAFWESYAGTGCTSLEAYNKFEEEFKTHELANLLTEVDMLLERLKEKDASIKDKQEERRKAIEKERYEKNINRLYDSYLCYTYQEVDDWEQDTFYNIESYYKGSDKCDSIRIQLAKPLNEELEEIVIKRIKNFFEKDAYNIIKDYDWLCSFGERRKDKQDYKLLDLELVDSEYNLVKKYQ